MCVCPAVAFWLSLLPQFCMQVVSVSAGDEPHRAAKVNVVRMAASLDPQGELIGVRNKKDRHVGPSFGVVDDPPADSSILPAEEGAHPSRRVTRRRLPIGSKGMMMQGGVQGFSLIAVESSVKIRIAAPKDETLDSGKLLAHGAAEEGGESLWQGFWRNLLAWTGGGRTQIDSYSSGFSLSATQLSALLCFVGLLLANAIRKGRCLSCCAFRATVAAASATEARAPTNDFFCRKAPTTLQGETSKLELQAEINA